MYLPLIGLLLLAQAPDVPDVGQRVVAELRNGYRIEGVLVEKDSRSAVLSIDSGELRLDLKRVLRFHVPEALSRESGEPVPPGHELRLPVAAKDGGPTLSLSVPETWKRVDAGTGALTYVDPDGEIRFRVEELTEAQSLWKVTAKIRRSYQDTLSGFEVKQERFGNRWTRIRTWEIDFEHNEGEQRYRERRLYLDFDDIKRVFIFRTRASSFAALVGHFERITSCMTLADSTSEPAEGRAPGEESTGSDSTAGGSKKARLEDLEHALEAEIRQALEGSAPAEE